MNSEILTSWLRAMVNAMPRGGKTEVSEMLGITPSGLSKILNNPHRAFDDKTVRALAWVQNSKADKFDKVQFPVKREITDGPLVIEERVNPAGGSFFVWRRVR